MKTFLSVFFAILAATAVIGAVFWGYGLKKQGDQIEALSRKAMPIRMRTIAIACITYASTYDGYPESLSDLAPPPAGQMPSKKQAGFIDEVLASGKIDGYLVFYTPTGRDKEGHVTSYSVVATRDGSKRSFVHNYFIDDQGILRATSEDRPATANDPAHFE